jgi:hypothetical protein
MKSIAACALVVTMTTNGCAIQESFHFTLSDGTVATSTADATGSVNNAGFLELGDGTWTLTMDLVGLAPGNHTLGAGAGELQISRPSGETYKVSLGGTCTVWLDAHGSSNGSPVTGTFTCAALTSTMGSTIDVENGAFKAPIEDPANNPLHK